MPRSLVLAPIVLALLLGSAPPAQALEVGDKATNFALKDAFGTTWSLGSFKKRILGVWYQGIGSRNQNAWINDKVSELLKSGQLPARNFDNAGIVNYQETAMPNQVLDLMIKVEARKRGAIILRDHDGTMQRLWGMRNGRANIYLFDAQRVLVWKTSGPLDLRRQKQFIRFLLRITK